MIRILINQLFSLLPQFVFWLCIGICLGVFVAMLCIVVRHRYSQRAKASRFHKYMAVEVLWVVIPFLILAVMLVPTVQMFMTMEQGRANNGVLVLMKY